MVGSSDNAQSDGIVLPQFPISRWQISSDSCEYDLVGDACGHERCAVCRGGRCIVKPVDCLVSEPGQCEGKIELRKLGFFSLAVGHAPANQTLVHVSRYQPALERLLRVIWFGRGSCKTGITGKRFARSMPSFDNRDVHQELKISSSSPQKKKEYKNAQVGWPEVAADSCLCNPNPQEHGPALCLNSGQDLTQIFHLTSHVQSFDKQKPAVYHHH